jgi:hypothetical protein
VVAVECEIKHRPAGRPPSSPIYPMIEGYATERSGWTRPAPVRAKRFAGCTDLAALDVANCPKRHRANARARHLLSAVAHGRSVCSPRYRQPGRCIVRVRFAAVWPRQHRAVSIADLIRRRRSQSGLSVMPAAPISLCHWLPPNGISSPKSWRKTPIVPTRPSGASEQTKARPGSRNRDGPSTCRYIRGQADRSKQTQRRQTRSG